YVNYYLTISCMSKKKYIINPEAEVSDSFYIKPDPLKKEYLFCWDFDNTIIKGNSHDFFDTLNITGSVPKELIDKFLAVPATGVKNPISLLFTIRTTLKQGHKIAITTLSEYPEVIGPALHKLGLTEDEIREIKIIAGLSSTHFPGKLKHIKKAMAHFGITTEQSVYLIDDDRENCALAKKNGYGVIKVEATDSEGYLTKINDLLTIKSTTDEFTRDKIFNKEAKSSEVTKVYTGTEEIDSFSFFPTPELPAFKTKPLKNSSLRKKLCFGQDKGFISSKPFSEDIFAKSLTDSLLSPFLQLEKNPVEILGEKFSPSLSESSD
ncbi:MAG: hypothetical protein KGO98_05480, partial [Rickettsiales bacterium]|nr:hypothetical protein [Rickettsiales bacterium]